LLYFSDRVSLFWPSWSEHNTFICTSQVDAITRSWDYRYVPPGSAYWLSSGGCLNNFSHRLISNCDLPVSTS
jgi:hypothetical protein